MVLYYNITRIEYDMCTSLIASHYAILFLVDIHLALAVRFICNKTYLFITRCFYDELFSAGLLFACQNSVKQRSPLLFIHIGNDIIQFILVFFLAHQTKYE